MPKKKTRRGAAKRFFSTKGGDVIKSKANRSHLLTKKSPKRKRGLRQPNSVSDADRGRVKKMLGK